MSYPSDLSDEQWRKLGKFFEGADPRGARERHPKRRVVEAIFCRLREGCRWRALPHDFPPWSTVAGHFRLWRARGGWQEALAALGTRRREVTLGRARRALRHAILDSQSVKTATGGQERGFHGGKMIKGPSRHVAIDGQGTLLAVRVTAANRADGVEAAEVRAQAVERHPSPESFTADKACRRQAEKAARELLGRELHMTAKPTQKKAARLSHSAGGWNAPSPGLAGADCSPRSTEKTLPSSEAWLWCAMMRLLVRRLAF